MEVLMATKREKDFLHDLDKRMAILEDSMDRLESNHINHLQKQNTVNLITPNTIPEQIYNIYSIC